MPPEGVKDRIPPDISPTTSDTLRRHASSWRAESRRLLGIADELDQQEEEIRHRLRAAMHRGSQTDPAGTRPPVCSDESTRLTARLVLLRHRAAQRDALQARRDLEELERIRRDVKKAEREAQTRAGQLEALVRPAEQPAMAESAG